MPVHLVSISKRPDVRAALSGRSTIDVIAPIPFSAFERWAETCWKRRGADYDQFKQTLADRLRADLEEHVPAVRGKIDYAEVSTPLSTRHFANFQHGEIYGLSATPKRFRLRSLGARTPIRNLFLTGADTCTSGVAGAMFGGIIAASAILSRNLVAKVSRPTVSRASESHASRLRPASSQQADSQALAD